MITIATVLNGTKYSYDHVNKLYNSLKANTIIDFRFCCYTDYPKNGFDKGIIVIPIEDDLKKLQWYKTDFFMKKFFVKNKIVEATDYNNVTIVMDIDLDIVGNVDFLFDPFPHHNFICSHRWWWRWREDTIAKKEKRIEPAVSGTIYKFVSKEHDYVAETFNADIEYWQEHFINNGTTNGPVNGEQHFVQMCMTYRKTNVEYFPERHIIKWTPDDFKEQTKLEENYKKWSGNDYIDKDGKFHPDVRIVHYAGS